MGPRDILVILGFVTWRDRLGRPPTYPMDRLLRALIERSGTDPRIGRLLVADPYRSHAVRLKRRGPPPAAPSGVQRVEPLRVGRRDPLSPRRAERLYRRYDRAVREAVEREGLNRPAVLTDHPLAAGFCDLEWAGPVTYYAWDDWAVHHSYAGHRAVYETAHAQVAQRGRAVCAVSSAILDRIAPRGPSAVVPNGVDPQEWRDPGPPPSWFAALPRPRLLYIGTLDRRLDAGAFTAAAHAVPGGTVVLVGAGDDKAHLGLLRDLPNVHVAPALDRARVPGLVAAADVGLVPHVPSPLTRAMSPLKLYEYLAAGLPVAAVDLEPIRGIDDRVVLCADGDFGAAVRSALAAGRAPEPERCAFIEHHAWARRHDQILEITLRKARAPA